MQAFADTQADTGVLAARRMHYSNEQRQELAELICGLFDRWNLDAGTQAELLGLSSATRSTLARYRKGGAVSEQRDQLERIGNLLGIHKSLRILYPFNEEMRYAWVHARNRRLDGRSPLDVMLEEGLPGIISIRNYTDWLRGR